MSKVRVRFAPSPTGPLHIGGVRTALYNYLFAKKHGGEFILRIEDTDQARFVEGAEAYVQAALSWCGISPTEGQGIGGDKGPYKQSERKKIYKSYAEQLVKEGSAYYAFDTVEELASIRKSYEEKGATFTYGIANRDKLKNSLTLSVKEIEVLMNESYVIRFKIPADKKIQIKDEIRGNMTIDSNVLDDKVLFKSDGMPTYHLANIVDDHLMEISHVIRGEEWLPSMALHCLLYEAFGWNPPIFAHLPLLLKPEGKGKLSKRDGDKHGFPVFPLEWTDPKEGTVSKGYKEEGYIPQAFINMLAFLGWNPGTEQEIFSLEELAQAFSLDKVSKSGACFDLAKAHWFNHQYLQRSEEEELLIQFEEILQKEGIEKTRSFNLKVIQSVKERASFVEDIYKQGKFFYFSPEGYNEKAVKKGFKEGVVGILEQVISLVSATDFSETALGESVKGWIVKEELGFGKVMQPLRLSLVGEMAGPDVFRIMEILGKEECVKRVNKALDFIRNQN